MEQMIQALRAALQSPKLSAKEQDVCADFMRAIQRYGSLTAKQAAWADKLVAKANSEAPKPAATIGNDGIKPVLALFEKAQSHGLKSPKIRLQSEAGERIILKLAGTASRYAGQVMLTDGEPYGIGRYYGRVDTDGNVHAGRDMTPADLYTVEFFKVRGIECKAISTHDGVYFDGLRQVFERATDLRTSL